MKREDLLKTALTEDKNVVTTIKNVLSKDARMFKKTKQDLDNEIEDLEEELESRLSDLFPLDKTVVVVTFAKLKALKAEKQLFEEFQKEFVVE